MRLSFLFFSVSLAALPVAAQQMTGEVLYRMCSGGREDGAIACAAYVQGYLDGDMDSPTRTFCLPHGTTVGMVAEGYVRFYNPSLAKIPARTALGAYLTEFPCRS